MKTFTLLFFFMIMFIWPCIAQEQSASFGLSIEGGKSISIIREDEFYYPSNYCTVGFGNTIGFAFQ
jgi:hypothetical protein